MQTIDELNAKLHSLDEEAQQIRGEGARLLQDAERLEVAAALTGAPSPAEAAEMRSQAEAGTHRVAAIEIARRATQKALEGMQRVDNARVASALVERVKAADQRLDAAYREFDAVMLVLEQKLGGLQIAHKAAEQHRREARALEEQGVISNAVLSGLQRRSELPTLAEERQDRNTGAVLQPMSQARHIAALRALFDKTIAELAALPGELAVDPPHFLVRWRIYRNAAAGFRREAPPRPDRTLDLPPTPPRAVNQRLRQQMDARRERHEARQRGYED